MRVIKYSESLKDEWNEFIKGSGNATFLFDRNFIEYHEDRFADYSLMVFDGDNLVSVIPANIFDNTIISHQGLTYGGFVFLKDVKLKQVSAVVFYVLKYLHEQTIENVRIKLLPAFYTEHLTEEIEYIFFLLEAKLYRRDTAFVIDQNNRIVYSGNIRREAAKAVKRNVQLKMEERFESFWNHLLVPNLKERFGVNPVHSLSEINLLKERFPGNIQQVNIYIDDEVVAGTTLFVTPTVVHCQYISSNENGRRAGALNYLFKEVIDKVYKTHRYFDFGIVNEKEGRVVNQGMLFWKESFGGRARKHDFYELKTGSFVKLVDVFPKLNDERV